MAGRADDHVMAAAVLVAPQQYQMQEVPRPQPEAGEVRVCLEGCGVCASNVPPWEGRPWFRYPFEPGAPGHEGWGVIDKLGEGVAGLSVGQRVAMLSMHAYAEYDVAPADQVVPLPDEVKGMPLPGEPLGCAVNVIRRSDIQPQQTVAIVARGLLWFVAGAIVCTQGGDCRRHLSARILAPSSTKRGGDACPAYGKCASRDRSGCGHHIGSNVRLCD